MTQAPSLLTKCFDFANAGCSTCLQMQVRGSRKTHPTVLPATTSFILTEAKHKYRSHVGGLRHPRWSRQGRQRCKDAGVALTNFRSVRLLLAISADQLVADPMATPQTSTTYIFLALSCPLNMAKVSLALCARTVKAVYPTSSPGIAC